MSNTYNQANALRDIVDERTRQDYKWGSIETGKFDRQSLYEGMTILTEEVGELAQECLRSDGEMGIVTRNYRTEAVQVAAVALKLIELYDRAHPGTP